MVTSRAVASVGSNRPILLIQSVYVMILFILTFTTQHPDSGPKASGGAGRTGTRYIIHVEKRDTWVIHRRTWALCIALRHFASVELKYGKTVPSGWGLLQVQGRSDGLGPPSLDLCTLLFLRGFLPMPLAGIMR